MLENREYPLIFIGEWIRLTEILFGISKRENKGRIFHLSRKIRLETKFQSPDKLSYVELYMLRMVSCVLWGTDCAALPRDLLPSPTAICWVNWQTLDYSNNHLRVVLRGISPSRLRLPAGVQLLPPTQWEQPTPDTDSKGAFANQHWCPLNWFPIPASPRFCHLGIAAFFYSSDCMWFKNNFLFFRVSRRSLN